MAHDATHEPAGRKRLMQRFIACPHCDSAAFKTGPRGGLAVNLYCLRCGAGYNIFLLPDGYYLDKEISPPQPQWKEAQ